MKTAVIAVLGGLLTVAGIALLVLPGPGFVLVAAGLAVLATRFSWAKRPLDYAKDKAQEGVEEVARSPWRAAGAVLAAPGADRCRRARPGRRGPAVRERVHRRRAHPLRALPGRDGGLRTSPGEARAGPGAAPGGRAGHRRRLPSRAARQLSTTTQPGRTTATGPGRLLEGVRAP